MIGQTAEVAPADKKLYALRDVTGTVESIPLISASIMSKKIAEGIDALVLDVKTGTGAFMRAMDESRGLAKSLVEVANGAGLKTSALITDMNQPLASVAGNAVEVMNAVEFLTGARIDKRLWDVTVALGGELLALGGLAKGDVDGRTQIEAAFTSGRAAELFGRMTAALGGPSDFMEHASDYLKEASVVRAVSAPEAGIVAAIDTRAIGIAVVELGGGRMRAADPIDHSVGFTALAGVGMKVGDVPLALVHARDESSAGRAEQALHAAYRIGETAPPPPTVYERIGA
jgi:thymidine phosphorylase